MSLRSLQIFPGSPAVYSFIRETPVDLARLVDVLLPDYPSLVWLDSARQHPLTGRYSVVGWDPWLILSASGDTVTLRTSASARIVRDNPLEVLRKTLGRYQGARHAAPSPVGLGLLGVLSYDLNRWIERLPPPKAAACAVPDLLMFGMRMLVVVDHVVGRSWCVSIVDPHRSQARAMREAQRRVEQLEALLETLSALERPDMAGDAAPCTTIDPAPSSLTTSKRRRVLSNSDWATPVIALESERRGGVEPWMRQAQFEAMVRQAQEHIAAGDIFQANLSQAFHTTWSASPWQLYLALRQINPSPFACFVTSPECSLVSCSPERLVQVREGVASARPIAGTRPRGANPQEDLVNSLELILSDKERAEHIMLVDLARNDLGRVCRFGSVAVNELMGLEDYSHVIHIVSNVQGAVRDGVEAVEIIRAMFPGGTITGCPKVRCMEILHELEPIARGFYTGSAGWLGGDGSLDLNILIRTMVLRGEQVWFHVGAGIVADSQPEREYHETLAKAGALMRALQGTDSTVTSDAARR